MALATQGTELYFIDPADDSVVTVGCTTSIDKSGGANNTVESYCLDSFDPTVMPGTRQAVTLTFGLNLDPANEAHVRLHEMFQASPPEKTYFAYGLSDGTADPTANASGGFTLPSTRSWYELYGFVSDLPNSIAGNAVVTATVSVYCDTCVFVPKGA